MVHVYGATGYTGTLIAEQAVRRGHRPILAGRNAEKLRVLGKRLGLTWWAFPLGDQVALFNEIQAFLAEMYATEVSPDFISSVTDAVMGEVTAWQARGTGGNLSGDHATNLHRASDPQQSRLCQLERAQAARGCDQTDLHCGERGSGRSRVM